jgi:hypothetical protein
MFINIQTQFNNHLPTNNIRKAIAIKNNIKKMLVYHAFGMEKLMSLDLIISF